MTIGDPGSREVVDPAHEATPSLREMSRKCPPLLRQDRELLWLPVLGMVTGLLAAGLLFVPGFLLGGAAGGTDSPAGGWVGGVLAALGASVVSVFFQAALVIGANERAGGLDPTLRGCLRQAWALRGRIVRWALLATTVGALVRALERRLGLVGTVLGFLGGLAWAVASFLVVPVLVAEDLGPVEGVKRSSALIRQTWGTSVRTTLRFGLLQLVVLVPAAAAIMVGVVVLAAGNALGLVLMVVGFLGLLGIGLLSSAVTGYARALIYRYAMGQPVPGIDPVLFVGAFRPGRRARRRLA